MAAGRSLLCPHSGNGKAIPYHTPGRIDEHDTPDTKYIVLLDGDFPVATCRLYELPEDEAELPTMMFGRIVVLPEYRKHGLGRLIVAEAKNGPGNWAAEKPCWTAAMWPSVFMKSWDIPLTLTKL